MKSDGRMSACGRITALLPELLDGGLADTVRSEVESHLVSCAECAAERDAIARTLLVVAEVRADEPGEAFYAAMRREVGRRLAAPSPGAVAKSRPLVLRPAWQAGFAVAATFAALLIWQPWQTDGGDYLAQLESASRRSLQELGASRMEPGALLMEEAGAAPKQVSDMIDELDDVELDRFLSALEAMKG